MTRFAIVLAASALTIVPASAAAGTATKAIGHPGVRLKGTNIWYAHAKATTPQTISAKVVPVPAQTVKVQWAVVCQKPNRSDPAYALATDTRQGQTSAHAPETVKLAIPYAKPPTCVATVYATLARSGVLTLQLLQS